MSQDTDRRKGLVGGSVEKRLAMSTIPPVDHDLILAPFRVEGDLARFQSFVSSPRPLEVEIGFGRAHHLAELAALHPEHHILGFETRRQWCKQAVGRAAREGLDGVRVIEGDARAFLEKLMPDGCVDRVHILFPDPWWKRRHHKRRVFTEAWLSLLWRILKPGGALVAKTDVPAYADLMECAITKHSKFRLIGTNACDPMLACLPRSHREKKCAEHDIPIYGLRYLKESV